MATLAAMDIYTSSSCRDRMDITCYTFGAPRTGNHAFARDFNEKVPNTWNIINDQDTVPRTGKFLIMYKRPGQRVLINSSGDMVVRPSFIEASMMRNKTSSVPQHLLASYQRAHVAIIKAQFTKKRLRNGTSGVLRIAKACGMQSLLSAAGIDTEHLHLQAQQRLERTGDVKPITGGFIQTALMVPSLKVARVCRTVVDPASIITAVVANAECAKYRRNTGETSAKYRFCSQWQLTVTPRSVLPQFRSRWRPGPSRHVPSNRRIR